MIHTKSLAQILEILKCREISPLTLTLETINRIKERESLNAFITVSEDSAMEAAKNSCTQSRSLEGLPIAVKDLFCTKNIRTTAASKMLENFVPQYESTVTKRLLDAGAIIVGKTNMDEFAMGSSNKTSYFGPVRNPWNEDYVAGGSSGGSAAAVADYLCYAAPGSDTGGSIRQPASLCGIVGLKPSYGRCSRFGMIAYSSSLDQAGVLARTVTDACIVLDHISGYCERDSTTSKTGPTELAKITSGITGKKVGYISAYLDKVSQSVRENWMEVLELVKKHGGEIIEIGLNEISDGAHDPIQQWTSVYYGFTTVEAFSNYCRYDGIRYGIQKDGKDLNDYYCNTRDQFGDEVKRRMLLGAYILSNHDKLDIYNRSISFRHLIRDQFMKIFKKVDVILSPTSPHTAFPIDYQKTPIEMYYEDMFTVVANLIGSPAISIPSGLCDKGLPIGMQVMAAPFDEVQMIEVAKFLESELHFKQLHEVRK